MIIYVFAVILIKILFVNFLYKSKKIKGAALLGFFYIFSSVVFLFSVIPLNTGYKVYLFTGLALSAFLFLVSCVGFLYFVLIFKDKIKNKIHRIFSFSLGFLIIETAIYYFLGFIMIQKGSSNVFDFSTIGAGYALALTPISKLFSYYGHIFILTFILALIISVINEYKLKCGIIILYIFCVMFYKVDDDTNNLPKVMILPEGINHEKIHDNLSRIKLNYDYLIEGGELVENNNTYNISKYYDFKKNITVVNYKYFLFPLGEYMPASAFTYKYAVSSTTNKIKIMQYTSKEENNLLSIYDKKALTLLCADAWSYKSVSRFKDFREEIDYVIVQRSDAIFNGSNLYKAQIKLYKHVLSDYFRKPIIDVTTYKYLDK